MGFEVAKAETPTRIFFAPHNDDETLFGAFTIIRYSPTVVVVLRSVKQEGSYGPEATSKVREAETTRALLELDCLDYEQWHYPDDGPDWEAVESSMRLIDDRLKPEMVFAPAWEKDGHAQHNEVAVRVERVFGTRVVSYLTYVRGSLRSRSLDPSIPANEVPFEPDWPVKKLRALACYRSQIALPQTNPWFLDDTLREFLA